MLKYSKQQQQQKRRLWQTIRMSRGKRCFNIRDYLTEAGGLAYLVKVLATKHGSLSSIPHGGRRELIFHAVLWHPQVLQGTQVCTWVHANISNSINTVITFQNSKVPKGSPHMQREKQKAKQIINLHKIKYFSNGICQTSLQCHWQGGEPGSPRCLNSHENIK